MRRAVLLCVAAGCRMHFDAAATDASTDTAESDGSATTITFGERTGAMQSEVTTDTFLHEQRATFNYGGFDEVSISGSTADRNNALLRFDLQAMPAGTAIFAARVELELLSFGDDVFGDFYAYVVGEAWTEGNGLEQMPTPGATWVERDTGTPWTTAGGSLLQRVATGTITPSTTTITLAIAPSIVQGWVDQPTTNHGLALLGDTDMATHFHFFSSENSEPAKRPMLVLDAAL